MLKTKHNKKRNTAFLYETIIREMTKAIINKDAKSKSFFVGVCKKYFANGSVLKKELELYKAVNESHSLDIKFAEKLLHEAKFQYEMLDKNKIFNEQTKLINVLNQATGGQIFSNFVPDYKNLASIAQVFNNSAPVKEKVLLENNLLKKMCSTPEEAESTKMETVDALAYKLFVKKFNEQYVDSLLSEQKELITKYVMSFADGGTEFKLFLNEEIERIKLGLKKSLSDKEIAADKNMKDKTNQLLQKVNTYSKRDIDTVMIQEVLKIQNLLKEINSEESKTNG